jgi:hypothetical protein
VRHRRRLRGALLRAGRAGRRVRDLRGALIPQSRKVST